MKLLNINQPFASALVLGIKKYETRGWPSDYREVVLIHANATRRLTKLSKNLLGVKLHPCDYGAIIGACLMNGCVEIHDDAAFYEKHGIDEWEKCFGIYRNGRHMFTFSDRTAFAFPRPHKSRQGRLLPAPPGFIDDICEYDRQNLLKLMEKAK